MEVADSALMTLSRAGRLASGWSPGAEGEEGSSSGRFWEGMAEDVAGDVDMLSFCVGITLSESSLWISRSHRVLNALVS